MALRGIPPLLEPYLSLPPEASLILLTSVLGASTNWLVLRYLCSALQAPIAAGGSQQSHARREDDGERGTGETTEGEAGGVDAELEGGQQHRDRPVAVVLVSFLRDMRFWREGARRLGLDLGKLAQQKRFAFVDGLSGLFLPGAGLGVDGEVVLRSAEPAKVYQDILGAVRSLQRVGATAGEEQGRYFGKVLLLVDAMDLLLATAGAEASSVGFGDMLMDLREHVHATVLTISNDSPLVLRQRTPLEINHAAFLLSLAHQAHLTMSLRLLDTGTARDVSGVIRIGVGETRWANPDEQIETKDLLYFVGGDGNVKVFVRGQ